MKMIAHLHLYHCINSEIDSAVSLLYTQVSVTLI